MPVPVNTNTQVQALVETFVVKGGYRLSLDEVVVPVALVADATPVQESAVWAGNQRTGVNRMHFSVHNPANSGVLLYLDEVTINSLAVNYIFNFGYGGTILANTDAQCVFTDLRVGAAPNGIFRYEDLAAIPVGGNQMGVWRMLSNAFHVMRYDNPIIIPEGQQWWIGAAANAQIVGLSMKWREVPGA